MFKANEPHTLQVNGRKWIVWPQLLVLIIQRVCSHHGDSVCECFLLCLAIVFMSALHRRSPAPQERKGALLVLMRSPSSTIQLKPAVWPIVAELLFLQPPRTAALFSSSAHALNTLQDYLCAPWRYEHRARREHLGEAGVLDNMVFLFFDLF